MDVIRYLRNIQNHGENIIHISAYFLNGVQSHTHISSLESNRLYWKLCNETNVCVIKWTWPSWILIFFVSWTISIRIDPDNFESIKGLTIFQFKIIQKHFGYQTFQNLNLPIRVSTNSTTNYNLHLIINRPQYFILYRLILLWISFVRNQIILSIFSIIPKLLLWSRTESLQKQNRKVLHRRWKKW